jgi:hypothetical protein
VKAIRKPSNADRAYAAGLLDGEGSVLISRRQSPHGRTYLMGVHIVNTYWPTLYWLQERWGGSVGRNRFQPNDSRGLRATRVCGQWIIAARMAVPFLEDTLPYLQIKREAALNALAFQQGQPSGGKRKPGRLQELERFHRIGQDLKLRVAGPR